MRRVIQVRIDRDDSKADEGYVNTNPYLLGLTTPISKGYFLGDDEKEGG